MSIERAIETRKEQIVNMTKVLKDLKKEKKNTTEVERRIEMVETEIKKLEGGKI